MTRRGLAVAVLVLAAGCSSIAVPPGGGGSPAETLTPVPEPGSIEARDLGAPELAPGVTAEGVADPFRLAAAHRAALWNRSYTVVRTTTVRDGNRTLRTVRRERRVAPHGVPYYYVQNETAVSDYPVRSFASRIEVWYDGDPALFRAVVDGEVVYQREQGATLGGPLSDLTGQDRIAGLLFAFEFDAAVDDAGPEGRVYRLRAVRTTGIETLDTPVLLSNPRDVEMSLRITEAGRILGYRLGYDATFRNRTVQVVRTVRFDDVGNTVVERPAWYARAANATRDNPTRDRHPGGDPVTNAPA